MGMIHLEICLRVRRQINLMRSREGIVPRKSRETSYALKWTENHEQILCSESETEESIVLNTLESRSTGAYFSLREQLIP